EVAAAGQGLLAGSNGAIVEQQHVVVSVSIHTLTRTIIRAAQLNLAASKDIYAESIGTLVIIAQQIGHNISPFDGLILRTIEG
ncbi:hypothetical protein ACNF3Z_13235, partial [Staphylococcus aureus]|uniref:hypothetical protein n=1 Tax=Staphylococcus aureus TaxID=1280 RepID=UPI003A7FAE21